MVDSGEVVVDNPLGYRTTRILTDRQIRWDFFIESIQESLAHQGAAMKIIANDTRRVKRLASASTSIKCTPRLPIEKVKVYTGLCYARPSVWTGLASVLDVGGTVVSVGTCGGSQKANRVAIASDWYAVGADLSRSCKKFAEGTSIKVGHGKSKRPL